MPESVVVDSKGEILVGAARNGWGSAVIKRLSPAGKLLQSYSVKRDDRGSDWIDLASDQRTVYYTSEGSKVLRYDIQADRQLPDFSNAGNIMYALRILQDGGVLVSNSHNVLRLGADGRISRTYLDGKSSLFALNLDPDGTSFWTAEQESWHIYRVEIATGRVISQIDSDTDIGGLCVFGELTAAVAPPATPPLPPPPPPPPTGKIAFDAAVPCAFGSMHSSSEGRSVLDLSGAQVTGYVDVEVRSPFRVSGATLELDAGNGWQPLGSSPLLLRVEEGASRRWPVRIRVGDCPGRIPTVPPPEIEIRTIQPDGRVDRMKVPVDARIVPDSWWHCWWPLVAMIAAALLGLFIFYGFWSPCRFHPRVGVMLAQEEDLDNEGFFYPIRGQPRSGSGFYRDATVYVCSDYRISGKASGALARLRAGRKQILMCPMASVWRRVADGEWEEVTQQEVPIRHGVVYRNEGKNLYFEIRTR